MICSSFSSKKRDRKGVIVKEDLIFWLISYYISRLLIWRVLIKFKGFLCSSASKEFACNAGDLGSIPGWEDPLEKGSPSSGGIPTLMFWPGEFH